MGVEGHSPLHSELRLDKIVSNKKKKIPIVMCASKSAYFFTDTAVSFLAMPPIPPLESWRVVKYCRHDLKEACHPRRESLSSRNAAGWAGRGSWRLTQFTTAHSSLFLTHTHTCQCFTLQSPKAANQSAANTYSPSFAQIASDTLRMISEPSKKTESQIFKTVWLGRHVAKRVRNHCIVKTLVSGGS